MRPIMSVGPGSRRQPGECVPLEQGLDDGHDPRVPTARGPRCDGLHVRATPGEDGHGAAAGRAVAVAVDPPAGAVPEARGRPPVDPEGDRLGDLERPGRPELGCPRTGTAPKSWSDT